MKIVLHHSRKSIWDTAYDQKLVYLKPDTVLQRKMTRTFTAIVNLHGLLKDFIVVNNWRYRKIDQRFVVAFWQLTNAFCVKFRRELFVYFENDQFQTALFTALDVVCGAVRCTRSLSVSFAFFVHSERNWLLRRVLWTPLQTILKKSLWHSFCTGKTKKLFCVTAKLKRVREQWQLYKELANQKWINRSRKTLQNCSISGKAFGRLCADGLYLVYILLAWVFSLLCTRAFGSSRNLSFPTHVCGKEWRVSFRFLRSAGDPSRLQKSLSRSLISSLGAFTFHAWTELSNPSFVCRSNSFKINGNDCSLSFTARIRLGICRCLAKERGKDVIFSNRSKINVNVYITSAYFYFKE